MAFKWFNPKTHKLTKISPDRLIAIPKEKVTDSFVLKLKEKALAGDPLVPSFTNIKNQNGKKIDGLVEQKDNLSLYEDAYRLNGMVHTSIDLTANFVINSNPHVQAETPELQAQFQSVCDSNSIKTKLLNTTKNMLVAGNAFWEVLPAGDSYTIKVIEPKTMRVIRDKAGTVTGYAQVFGQNVVTTFTTEEVIHFKWGDYGMDAYGNSDIKPITSALANMLETLNDIKRIMHYSAPIIHLKVGTDEAPATSSMVSNLKSELEDRDVGSQFITDHYVTTSIISPASAIGNLEGLVYIIQDQVLVGLQVPQVYLPGGRKKESSSSSRIEKEGFERRIKTIQLVISEGIMKLFGLIARKRGSKTVPKLVWDEPDNEDAWMKAKTLRMLKGKGDGDSIITTDEARDELNLGPNDELGSV